MATGRLPGAHAVDEAGATDAATPAQQQRARQGAETRRAAAFKRAYGTQLAREGPIQAADKGTISQAQAEQEKRQIEDADAAEYSHLTSSWAPPANDIPPGMHRNYSDGSEWARDQWGNLYRVK